MTSLLIIDPNEHNARLMAAYLRMNGMSVSLASAGKTGYRWAEETQPDIILCDLRLPGSTWNGAMTCQYLKTHPRTRHIPVIALLGMGELAPAHLPDFDGVLTQPYSLHDLDELLTAHLHRVQRAS